MNKKSSDIVTCIDALIDLNKKGKLADSAIKEELKSYNLMEHPNYVQLKPILNVLERDDTRIANKRLSFVF